MFTIVFVNVACLVFFEYHISTFYRSSKPIQIYMIFKKQNR